MLMLLMLLNLELLIDLCPMNDLHFLEEGLEEGSHPKTRQVKTGHCTSSQNIQLFPTKFFLVLSLLFTKLYFFIFFVG